MAAQIKSANANGAALSKEVAHLRSQLGIPQGLSPRGQLQEALLSQSSSSSSISNDIFADANRYKMYVFCVCHVKKPFTALVFEGAETVQQDYVDPHNFLAAQLTLSPKMLPTEVMAVVLVCAASVCEGQDRENKDTAHVCKAVIQQC